MQSGDHDDKSIQSSGVIDPVRTTLRNTPIKPWVGRYVGDAAACEAYSRRAGAADDLTSLSPWDLTLFNIVFNSGAGCEGYGNVRGPRRIG